MATIIDSLLVTLGLDATKFKRGAAEVSKAQKNLADQTKREGKERETIDRKAEEAQTRRAKEFERQGKQAAQVFSKIRNQALSLLAVFTAGRGLYDFTKSTINQTAALGRLSKIVGISVSDLSAWGLAAEKAGGSASEMYGVILKLSQNAAAFRAGMPNAENSAYLAFGGAFGAKASDLKDAQSYLHGLEGVLHAMTQRLGAAKAYMLASKMGVSYNEFNVLSAGPAALDAQISANKKLTGITGKMAGEAQIALEKWVNLRAEFTQTGNVVLFALMPVLDQLSQYLMKLAQWAADHREDIKAWAQKAVEWIGKFVDKANEAAQALGGWKIVLEGLLALKIASMISPLLGLAAALTKVGLALRAVPLVAAGLAGYWLGGKINSGIINPLVSKAVGHKETLGGWLYSSTHPANTRGMRNNNPGNIKYGPFAKRMGAIGADAQGFAIFATMSAGQMAARALLGNYVSSGTNTIRKIVSRWAPAGVDGNNTAAYIAAVSKQTGISPDQIVSGSDLGRIANAIYTHENGSWGGASLRMPTGAGAGRVGVGPGSTITSTTHIGQITINTQATDAAGIAGSIWPELNRQGMSFAAQANSGGF